MKTKNHQSPSNDSQSEGTMDVHADSGTIRVTTVGFKLTPSIYQKVLSSLEPVRKSKCGLVRVRTKLRFFNNGPRRDSFQVRMRLEKRGHDLVTVIKGHDLYVLIEQAAKRTLARLISKNKKRIQDRKSDPGHIQALLT